MNRLIETDKWTTVRAEIEEEISRRMEDLLSVKSMEELAEQRGWIEALQWVIDEPDSNNDEDR